MSKLSETIRSLKIYATKLQDGVLTSYAEDIEREVVELEAGLAYCTTLLEKTRKVIGYKKPE